jgi:hypothetical protein
VSTRECGTFFQSRHGHKISGAIYIDRRVVESLITHSFVPYKMSPPAGLSGKKESGTARILGSGASGKSPCGCSG